LRPRSQPIDSLNRPDSVKEFYFVLTIDTERPPWILTRHKCPSNPLKGLTNRGLSPVNEGISSLLSKGIGWLTKKQLRMILEIAKGQFKTEGERKFVDDLIVCL
jgi:hypothetical protein